MLCSQSIDEALSSFHRTKSGSKRSQRPVPSKMPSFVCSWCLRYGSSESQPRISVLFDPERSQPGDWSLTVRLTVEMIRNFRQLVAPTPHRSVKGLENTLQLRVVVETRCIAWISTVTTPRAISLTLLSSQGETAVDISLGRGYDIEAQIRGFQDTALEDALRDESARFSMAAAH